MSPLIIKALRQKEFCPDVVPSKFEIGLLIFDEMSRLQHANPQGRKLMFLATHPDVKKGIPFPMDRLPIPDEIKLLVQKLREEFNDDLFAYQAPKWEINNPWGSFIFQANWFQRTVNEDKGLIAVSVQYQEPALYRVMMQCHALNFTGRQTEVISELIKGLSYDAVADKLHVSAHTVKDHVKKIYEKLEIHNRGELLPALLSAQVGTN